MSNDSPIPPAASASPRWRHWWGRASAGLADAGTFSLLNLLQARHGDHATTPAEIDAYLAIHGRRSFAQFYETPPTVDPAEGPLLPPPEAPPRFDPAGAPLGYPVCWPSPLPGPFPANNVAHADFYPCRPGWNTAPTVFLLHALMSASDRGYRRLWTTAFHARGWNTCFLHLPFHYSRRVPGYWTGELAIGSNLVRTGEALRQGVMELRQLRRAFAAVEGKTFGIWGTSYGGWIGALWSCVESGFRFVALIQPIVDVADAIWRSAAGRTVRRQLARSGVTLDTPNLPAMLRLGMPGAHQPLDDHRRVLLLAGDHDRIVTPQSLQMLHERWRGSRFYRAPQGHFGTQLMPEALRQLDLGGDLRIREASA